MPKYRRLIRSVTEVATKVMGEKQMPTILEQLRDEGIAVGEARGEVRVLRKEKC